MKYLFCLIPVTTLISCNNTDNQKETTKIKYVEIPLKVDDLKRMIEYTKNKAEGLNKSEYGKPYHFKRFNGIGSICTHMCQRHSFYYYPDGLFPKEDIQMEYVKLFFWREFTGIKQLDRNKDPRKKGYDFLRLEYYTSSTAKMDYDNEIVVQMRGKRTSSKQIKFENSILTFKEYRLENYKIFIHNDSVFPRTIIKIEKL